MTTIKDHHARLNAEREAKKQVMPAPAVKQAPKAVAPVKAKTKNKTK